MRTVNTNELDLVPRGRHDHANKIYEKVAAKVAILRPSKALVLKPDSKDGETLAKAHARIRAGVRRALDRDALTARVRFKIRSTKDGRLAVTRLPG